MISSMYNLLIISLLALLAGFAFWKRKPMEGVFIACNGSLATFLHYLNPDPATSLLSSLIFFLSSVILLFSSDYLAGDKEHLSFKLKIELLTLLMIIWINLNSLLWLGLGWIVINALLFSLMVHKNEWKAARSGGALYLKYQALGLTIGLFSLFSLAYLGGSFSLDVLNGKLLSDPSVNLPLIGLAIAAFIQAGLFPFHGWLISSLNSPTPVSAFMHAGIVTSGAILLMKFTPLFTEELLFFIFTVGFLTLWPASLIKLVQGNVKQMLASSTSAQMSFMFMQIGLGLYANALLHILWHGLFKAHLFLDSGSVLENGVNTKKQEIPYSLALFTLFLALMGFSSFIALYGTEKGGLLLGLFASISSGAWGYSLLRPLNYRSALKAIGGSTLFGASYALFMKGGEALFELETLTHPQALHERHFLLMAVMFFSLIVFFCLKNENPVKAWLWTKAFRFGKPSLKTVTLHSTEYRI